MGKGISFKYSLPSFLWTKEAYQTVAADFHVYHKHDLDCFLHILTTGFGLWGAVQMFVSLDQLMVVYVYAATIALTVPFRTAALHSVLLYGFLLVSLDIIPLQMDPVKLSSIVIGTGFVLQDVAHYICVEQTMISSYINSNPSMFFLHTLWLMPLIIDSILQRHFFLPLIVSRNRNFFEPVASRKEVEEIGDWITENIPEKPETTHLWPHEEKGLDAQVTVLENDTTIMAAFRKLFAPHHFDIKPVVGMNEIYVTATGAIKNITSDAVFYTSHFDGPYWWLPGASLYRVLIGVTPNKMVRTRFNLQHETQDKVLNKYDALGFDYNRELHLIDHVPGESNKDRRSLVKLHFIVYPKGWHKYGAFCANMNQTYNTWARGNFLKTLRPETVSDSVLAWWIWITTYCNSAFELHVGWNNLVYLLGAYALGSLPFLILTSYRHYTIYIAAFAYRSPPIGHGYLMRDAKLFKTIAIMHLAKRLLPVINLPVDLPGVGLAAIGFSITILATVQLGMVRTYFGAELGFVEPKWISKFPYGTIPHPMIVGQLFAYSSILYWWRNEMAFETFALIVGHLSCYVVHMMQEMLYSSY